ncbi:ATP-binding protein [Streptomyces olivaceus]|uniref:ATP-binding protein n=1 Tax=Streptomyces olivaceus TaxID=47716 RepID=A0ABS7W558_STROV|nr:ATP-binding protein [Streptomyces olivaceus]MBZ6089629.1 ATP-binding protein [Streptomyces olivaceus]MBZ6098600.1 ATP-binding protein [Streptomyces olivaceus]MBZ6120020.1 ATP-binding protein [Streptomyces olivaceus]MBZ6152325.1 ATP-binding protein [Streptomyces olivaceus]MBZ6301233.1 ATP-binding protein [Streptomyces olivaceus]
MLITMTSSDGGVSDARRAATAFVARQWPDANLGALALVVSELVANAARHAGGWWRLTVRAEGRAIVVDVDDRSPAVPTARVADTDGLGGHGLNIVRELFGPVEILPRGDGKTVRVRWAAGRPAYGTASGPYPDGASGLVGREP